MSCECCLADCVYDFVSIVRCNHINCKKVKENWGAVNFVPERHKIMRPIKFVVYAGNRCREVNICHIHLLHAIFRSAFTVYFIVFEWYLDWEIWYTRTCGGCLRMCVCVYELIRIEILLTNFSQWKFNHVNWPINPLPDAGQLHDPMCRTREVLLTQSKWNEQTVICAFRARTNKYTTFYNFIHI